MTIKNKEFYTVGWVQDAQGIRGENFVRFFTEQPDWINEVVEYQLLDVSRDCKERLKKKSSSKTINESEVLKSEHKKINKIKAHKNGFIVSFYGVSDRNQAESLKGYIIQIDKSIIDKDSTQDSFYFEKIIGFKVIDINTNVDCGHVKSHYNNGAHDILILESNFSGKEIPFVDDFIEKIDFSQQVISMKLPQGLLDI